MISAQKNVKSIAQIKVNFMKSEDKIVDCQSKVWNRTYADSLRGVVGELTDGMNLFTNMTDVGQFDITDEIIGMTVNLRFTDEQWEALNAQFHEMGGIGAHIEIELDDHVRWGTLEIRGEEVESYTIYVKDVVAVEEMEIARVGSMTTKEDFLARLRAAKAKKAAKSEEARAQSRSARAGLAKAGSKEVTPMNFGG